MNIADGAVRPRPWATAALAALAVVAWWWPGATDALAYERDAVLHGEWWRLWTGSIAHWSASHLAWNLAVFLPAGVWAERLAPGRLRWFVGVAPAAIGLVLLTAEPGLARYAGLSGVAAAVLALLALTKLGERGADRWLWGGMLGLLAAKVAADFWAEAPLLARFAEPGVRAVPLAHLTGIAAAVAVRFAGRR